ncbi:hypothetical protein PPYR_11222 [Photinus pyralis]|uniref:Kinesin motor domain-containing protein n=1 Tax=Photinus pyralis TaxID=7054 RepID=A0A1Y1M5N1_PHOPY|nr:kinesin-like protein subito [Photinus pyralis]KAB0794383.1 hypothetical protein PPYR_11222 [Photinus pyralis]
MSQEEVSSENISYLNPRVFSILAQNFPTNNDEVAVPDISSEEGNFLRVYLRIKKAENFKHVYAINNNTLHCKVPPANKIVKMYKFSKIFGPHATQSEIYNDVVLKKVTKFIQGINCTLLTYGSSGSGKTFTLQGTPTEPGIVPRALEYFFQTLPALPSKPHIKPTPSGGIMKLSSSESAQERLTVTNLMKHSGDPAQHFRTYSVMQQHLKDNPVGVIDDDISDVHLSVWVSFAEIYNEHVYDLLVTEPKRGHPRKKLRMVYFNNNAYIKDLQHINVSSAAEAYFLLRYGLQNLNYASTAVNDHSSRSHSIFTIKLAQASDSKSGVSVSAFNFCDLAGSERLKKTNNVGDRLKESNNINASLLVFGRCIHAVRDSQKLKNSQLMPWRESKLTQLFQNALLGNESISMIVCINPAREMFDESQHVLNFSAIAKDVAVERQQPIQRLKINKFDKDSVILEEDLTSSLEELHNYLAFLCNEIEQDGLNHTEYLEHITSTYKKMIENTKKVWENTCKDVETCIEKHNQELLQSSTSPIKSRKRKKMSVVCIDTSSDEENQVPNKTKEKRKQKGSQELQKQLCQLQMERDANVVELENLSARNKALKVDNEEYQALQKERKELETQTVIEEDILADLNRYLH